MNNKRDSFAALPVKLIHDRWQVPCLVLPADEMDFDALVQNMHTQHVTDSWIPLTGWEPYVKVVCLRRFDTNEYYFLRPTAPPAITVRDLPDPPGALPWIDDEPRGIPVKGTIGDDTFDDEKIQRHREAVNKLDEIRKTNQQEFNKRFPVPPLSRDDAAIVEHAKALMEDFKPNSITASADFFSPETKEIIRETVEQAEREAQMHLDAPPVVPSQVQRDLSIEVDKEILTVSYPTHFDADGMKVTTLPAGAGLEFAAAGPALNKPCLTCRVRESNLGRRYCNGCWNQARRSTHEQNKNKKPRS